MSSSVSFAFTTTVLSPHPSVGMDGKTTRVAVPVAVNPNADIKDITAPVLLDLIQLRENLTALVGASNPMLLKVCLLSLSLYEHHLTVQRFELSYYASLPIREKRMCKT